MRELAINNKSSDPISQGKKRMRGKGLGHLCCTRLKHHHSSGNAPPQSHNSNHVLSSSASSSVSSSPPVFKNFNSLYDPAAAGGSDSETLAGFGSGSTSWTRTTMEDEESESEPDLSTVFAARRLLRPASTGRSNSIVQEEGGEEEDGDASGSGRVGFGAVPKMSPDPYDDFKRSMEEMVAALGLAAAEEQQQLSGAHQARLQELLLCYLALNRKTAHKYIVGAFADVLRGLTPE